MTKVTKMILLDKFRVSAAHKKDFLAESNIADFIGTPLFELVNGEYVEGAAIAEITLVDEILTIDGKSSFYDDFDFDFTVVDGVETPEAVYVLEIDSNASDLSPEDPEDPEEPYTGLETGDGYTLVDDQGQPIVIS